MSRLNSCPPAISRGATSEDFDSDAEHSSLTSQPENALARQGWEQVIDTKLLEWGVDPSALDDEEFRAPSRATIGLACRVVTALRNMGVSSPTRVVPNGEGGIVFERKAGTVFETIEVREDGKIEVANYQNSVLTNRKVIEFTESNLSHGDP